MSISYSIELDFDDDGNFTDLGEAIQAEVLEASWRLGMPAPYTRLSSPARAEILLRNRSGAFSPEIAGNLIGKTLRIQSDNGTVRTHFIGKIESLEPEAGQYGKRRATLLAYGREAELNTQRIRLPLLTNFRVDEALEAILSQLQWRYIGLSSMAIIGQSSIGSSMIFPDNAFAQNLDIGEVLFSYLGDDWLEGLSADAALEQLMLAEAGRFFFNREGEAIFYNRYHLLQDTAVVATFDDSMASLDYQYGGTVVNHLEVIVRPRTLGTPNKLIWQLANPLRIKKSMIVQINASYKVDGFPVGAMDVIPPVRHTDYEAFEEADGTGDKMSGYIQVILLEAGASAARFEIRNRAKRKAYITRLQLYGTPLFGGDPMTVSVEDRFSQGYYGFSSMRLNIPILSDVDEADSIARWELSRRNNPLGLVREISTNIIQHPNETLSLSLFDRIRIIESQTGHDAKYHIIAEEHHLSKAGTRHTVKWLVELAEVEQFFIIGTHSIGDTNVVIVPY